MFSFKPPLSFYHLKLFDLHQTISRVAVPFTAACAALPVIHCCQVPVNQTPSSLILYARTSRCCSYVQ